MTHRDYRINDYAIIGNCETAALINPDGGIDWLCLPAFDAPSFFGALLDSEQAGAFTIRPTIPYQSERQYLEHSAILTTRFVTTHGTVVLTDFFVIACAPEARFYDFTSLYPTQKLVRMVQVTSGQDIPIALQLNARPNPITPT